MIFEIPSGYEKFCKPTKYCESDVPEIIQLAESITKDKKTSRESAEALFEWVRDNIPWTVDKIVGAKKVLKREPKQAICMDKTNLFIALCRALGIPARYVLLDCEFDIKKSDIPRWTKHAVAEVFVNSEWIIADPSFGKHTKKLMDINQFGKVSWVNAKNMKRVEELSGFFVLIGNLVMSIAPFSKKLKKAIEETKE